MEILKQIPRNVGSKIKFHFRHPNAKIIENYWRAPILLQRKFLIAQLNRFNWLIYSYKYHQYGNDVVLWWRSNLLIKDFPKLKGRLYIHDILDPSGNKRLLDINYLIMNVHQYKSSLKRLWSCPTKKFQRLKWWDQDTEWKKRSLYGGLYPIYHRPQVRVPRNPWTKKWNLRWKKGGNLIKLCAQEWKRQPYRMCEWDGAGTIIHKLDGSKDIYMGPLNIDFIPISTHGIDIFV